MSAIRRMDTCRARRGWLAAAAAAALGLAGCAGGPPPAAPADTILVIGDSLSAGYGLQPGTGWVWLLARRLAAERPAAQVVNASVSGEVTPTGRASVAQLLRLHRPTVVVIELGSDDAFGNIPLQTTAANLTYIARAARAAGARVMVIGVRVPSRYGEAYARRFADMYASVAASTGAVLVPNLLDRVDNAPDPAGLFQRDNIHPNERAQGTLLDNVWPELRKLLK